METAPLKSFATWARTALIREVSARMAAVLAPGSAERVEQAEAVAALERAIAAAGGGEQGRAAVADRVAYTWFNRIIALRFMDANGYTGIGVVSPQAGVAGRPAGDPGRRQARHHRHRRGRRQRPAETVTGLLDGTRRSSDPQGEAYALLLADYCRHWNRAMPFMFEREGDFTELLIPANLLADDSVLTRAVEVLTDEVCAGRRGHRLALPVLHLRAQGRGLRRVQEEQEGRRRRNPRRHPAVHPALDRPLPGRELARPAVDAQPALLPAGRADGLLHRPGRRRDRLPQDQQPRGAQGHRPGLRIRAHAHLRLRPALRDLRRRGLRTRRNPRPDPRPTTSTASRSTPAPARSPRSR